MKCKAEVLHIDPRYVKVKLFDPPTARWTEMTHILAGVTKPTDVKVGEIYEAEYFTNSNSGLWFLGSKLK